MTIGSLSPSPPEELPPPVLLPLPPRLLDPLGGEREDPDRREDGDRSADLRGLLRLPGLLAAAPPEAFEPAGGRGRATNLIVTLCNSVIV